MIFKISLIVMSDLKSIIIQKWYFISWEQCQQNLGEVVFDSTKLNYRKVTYSENHKATNQPLNLEM